MGPEGNYGLDFRTMVPRGWGRSCNSTYTRRSIEKLSRLEPQSFSIIKLNLWSGRPAIKSIRYESTIFRLFGQIFVSHKNGMEWDNQFPGASFVGKLPSNDKTRPKDSMRRFSTVVKLRFGRNGLDLENRFMFHLIDET